MKRFLSCDLYVAFCVENYYTARDPSVILSLLIRRLFLPATIIIALLFPNMRVKNRLSEFSEIIVFFNRLQLHIILPETVMEMK